MLKRLFIAASLVASTGLVAGATDAVAAQTANAATTCSAARQAVVQNTAKKCKKVKENGLTCKYCKKKKKGKWEKIKWIRKWCKDLSWKDRPGGPYDDEPGGH